MNREAHLGRLARCQLDSREPDELSNRTSHAGNRVSGIELHDFVTIPGAVVGDRDGHVDRAGGVHLRCTDLRIPVAERGVGQPVPEGECWSRVEIADSFAVLSQRWREVGVRLATWMARNPYRQLAR